jgi:hypothetical protein
MDSKDPNTDQLDRLESKLDEILDNQEYSMGKDGHFKGFIYGSFIVGLTTILTKYLDWW